MSSTTRIALAALVAVGTLAVALLVFAPGRQHPTSEPRLRTEEPPSPPPVPLQARGTGVIAGLVELLGNAPIMQPLKLGVDPACAAGPRLDEQVIVSDGKLANVFVRVLDAGPEPPPNLAAVIDQRRCVFHPRVQGAVRGQRVEIRNGDPTLHNVHGYAAASTLFNYAQPAGAPPVQLARTERTGLIKLKCDVHPWMTAFLHVEENSHFAVTGADGAFAIDGLSARRYQVEAWHERFGPKRASIEVAEGQTARLSFSYSPEDRE